MNLKLAFLLTIVAGTVVPDVMGDSLSGKSAAKAITDRCSRRLVKGYLYKEESDGSGAPREGKPLIIFERNKPSKANLRVYARNGTLICYFKRWNEEAKYGRRFYSGTGCGYSASRLAAAARAAAGSSQIYIEGPTNSCVGPIDPTKRKDTR